MLETGIVLPFCLLVIVTMLMLSRIALIHVRMQHALGEAARELAAHAYLYALTGLDDASDSLRELREEAGSTISSDSGSILPYLGMLQPSASAGEATESEDTPATISESMRTIAAVFIEPMTADLRSSACGSLCLSLAEQAMKRELGTQGDPFLGLGIIDGKNGVDMSQTQAFVEDDALVIVASYSARVPDPLSILPEIRMTNRIRLNAWMSGCGSGVRNAPDPGETDPDTSADTEETSLWDEMDGAGEYRARGSRIEETTLLTERGILAPGRRIIDHGAYGAHIDYLSVQAAAGSAEAIQAFTLNPFLQSYAGHPAAIASKLRRNASGLLAFGPTEARAYAEDPEIRTVVRVLVMIVPENAGPEVEAAVAAECESLRMAGIDEIRIIRGYGSYATETESTGTTP